MIVNIIFSLAALFIFFSYLFKDILWLRVVSVLGATIYIAGAFVAGLGLPGMFATLLWSLVNASVNVYHIIHIILERRLASSNTR